MISKKGLSPIIAYVILVVIVITTSLVVYPWLQTYLAVSPDSCPEGVSIYLNKISCESDTNVYYLNLTIKNNGRFGIGGYFINFRGVDNKLIPWNDENILLKESQANIASGDIGQKNLRPGVQFIGSNSDATGAQTNVNPLNPDGAIESFFILNSEVVSVELIPYRWEGEKKRLVSCGKAIIRDNVYCN